MDYPQNLIDFRSILILTINQIKDILFLKAAWLECAGWLCRARAERDPQIVRHTVSKVVRKER